MDFFFQFLGKSLLSILENPLGKEFPGRNFHGKSWDAPGKRKMRIINPVLRFLGEVYGKKINFVPLKVKNSLIFYEEKKNSSFKGFKSPDFEMFKRPWYFQINLTSLKV